MKISASVNVDWRSQILPLLVRNIACVCVHVEPHYVWICLKKCQPNTTRTRSYIKLNLPLVDRKTLFSIIYLTNVLLIVNLITSIKSGLFQRHNESLRLEGA